MTHTDPDDDWFDADLAWYGWVGLLIFLAVAGMLIIITFW